jgi:hypothetical protein
MSASERRSHPGDGHRSAKPSKCDYSGVMRASAVAAMDDAHQEPDGLRLLVAARGLVVRGWCRGADARNAAGAEVHPWDAEAVSWSLLGAIVAVLEWEAQHRGEMPIEDLAAALYALADVIDTDSLVDWNDELGRTQDDVTAVLSAAAERYSPWPRTALSNSG